MSGPLETFRQVENARPLWQVPQLHNWANYQVAVHSMQVEIGGNQVKVPLIDLRVPA